MDSIAKIAELEFAEKEKMKDKVTTRAMIGECTLLRFSGVPLGEVFTVVIRGGIQQIIDEANRSQHG